MPILHSRAPRAKFSTDGPAAPRARGVFAIVEAMDDDLPTIMRTSTFGTHGRAASALRRRQRAGTLHRVAPGCFVPADVWQQLWPREQHVLLVRAHVPLVDSRCVVSHSSAAAVHGWADLDTLPARIHVTRDRGRPQLRSLVRIHVAPLAVDDIVEVDGLRVTSPLRTAIDVAHDIPFAGAVAAVDSALHLDMFDKTVLSEAFARYAERRGREEARHVLRFSDGRAESAAESLGRIVLCELGAPKPVLQKKLYDGTRELARVDFFFDGQGVVLETDGFVKYADERYLRGRDPADVFVNEKRREQELMLSPEVRAVIRAEWRDLRQPARLRRLLIGAGVPVP